MPTRGRTDRTQSDMQLHQHPLLIELESSLVDIVPSETVSLVGDWKSSRRRTYENEAQIGSGSGPFVEIVDTRWTGALACSVPIACIAFMLTPDSLSWAKSSPASLNLPVDVSISAYAGYTPDRATFAATVGGAHLPSVSTRFGGDASRDVMIETTGHTTGQLARLAHLEHAEVVVYLIPGRLLKVGRKRLWHIRSDLATALPSVTRELLTHGRNKRIQSRS
jgi:hypothetical protein